MPLVFTGVWKTRRVLFVREWHVFLAQDGNSLEILLKCRENTESQNHLLTFCFREITFVCVAWMSSSEKNFPLNIL